jgi:RNA polymerase sigma-70 factor (ECF subfamily)
MTPGPPTPEPEMVERLRAGDPGALTQAYDRHSAMVYRIGYRLLGETADAEDLVQDVFTGLPRAARSFEGRSSFGWWLNRVATRTALMLLRQRRVQRRHSEQLGGMTSRASSGDAPAARMDLENALRALDEPHRIVFVLREIEGYSHQEIAELLGLRVGTVRVRLHRARRRLHAYLEAC